MITVGMRLTTDTNGLGMTGRMVVTAIEPCNPEMPFYEGDTVRVHETIEDDGKIIREYDTFFMSHKLVDGVLVFNDWQWFVSYQEFSGLGLTVGLHRQGDTLSYFMTGGGIAEQVGTTHMSEADLLDVLLSPLGAKVDGANIVQA